jgi:hypothetical protein
MLRLTSSRTKAPPSPPVVSPARGDAFPRSSSAGSSRQAAGSAGNVLLALGGDFPTLEGMRGSADEPTEEPFSSGQSWPSGTENPLNGAETASFSPTDFTPEVTRSDDPFSRPRRGSLPTRRVAEGLAAGCSARVKPEQRAIVKRASRCLLAFLCLLTLLLFTTFKLIMGGDHVKPFVAPAAAPPPASANVIVLGTTTFASSSTEGGGSSCWSPPLCTPSASGVLAVDTYGNDEEHMWRLKCPRGQAAFLRFTSFSTEAIFDSVWLYDGATEAGEPQLGDWSGDRSPSGQFGSPDGEMLLVFRSDSSVSAGGFAADYACGGKVKKGCTDPNATQGYNAHATVQDASCIYDGQQQESLLQAFVVDDVDADNQTAAQSSLPGMFGRGWDTKSDPCGNRGWYGVHCDRYQFHGTAADTCSTQLCKSTAAVTGTSSSLLAHPLVSAIDLSGSSHFTFRLGPSIGLLKNLRKLHLDDSGLIGTLPYQLSGASSLRLLSMVNTRISGTIPEDVCRMSLLSTLSLRGTWISGSMPSFNEDSPLMILDAGNSSLTALPGVLPHNLSHVYLDDSPFNETAADFGHLITSLPRVKSFAVGGIRNAHIMMAFTQSFDKRATAFNFNTRCSVEQCNGPRVRSPGQCELGGACAFKIHVYDGYEWPARTGGLVHDLSIGFNCTNVGGRCKFPFLFKGTNQSRCVAWSDGREWCAVDSPYCYHNQAHDVPYATPWGHCNADGRTVDTVYHTPHPGGVRRSDCAVTHPMQDNRDGTFTASVPREWGHSVLSPGKTMFHFFHEDIEFTPIVDSNNVVLDGDDIPKLRTVEFRPKRCSLDTYDVLHTGKYTCVQGLNRSTIPAAVDSAGIPTRCQPCPKTSLGLACAVCEDGVINLKAGWHLNASDRAGFLALLRRGHSLSGASGSGAEQYIFPCLQDQDCPALSLNVSTSQSPCKSGLTGRLCNSCEIGRTRSVGGFGAGTDECEACGERSRHLSSIRWIVVVLLVVLLGVYLRRCAALRQAQDTDGTRMDNIIEQIANLPVDEILQTLKITCNFMQILYIYNYSPNNYIKLPAWLSWYCSLVTDLLLDVQFFSDARCQYEMNLDSDQHADYRYANGFYLSWIAHVIVLPALVWLLLACIYIFRRQMQRATKRQVRQRQETNFEMTISQRLSETDSEPVLDAETARVNQEIDVVVHGAYDTWRRRQFVASALLYPCTTSAS